MFSQVTALPKARPAGNPRRYPHVAHRSTVPLHKSSTGLRTGKPWLAEAPAERLPAPLAGTRTAGRTVHAYHGSAAAATGQGGGRSGSPDSFRTPMIRPPPTSPSPTTGKDPAPAPHSFGVDGAAPGGCVRPPMPAYRARRWATSHGATRLRLAWAGHRRPLALPYIAGIPETCRPGSSHGNQIASAPIATSNTPTAWPNGFP